MDGKQKTWSWRFPVSAKHQGVGKPQQSNRMRKAKMATPQLMVTEPGRKLPRLSRQQRERLSGKSRGKGRRSKAGPSQIQADSQANAGPKVAVAKRASGKFNPKMKAEAASPKEKAEAASPKEKRGCQFEERDAES